MAKGSQKQAGRGKLPKRIAGTKVPKALRKSGIARWALSTEGREIIGSLLVAGATALMIGKRGAISRRAKDAGPALQKTGQALAEGIADLVAGVAPSPATGTGRRSRSNTVRPKSSPH